MFEIIVNWVSHQFPRLDHDGAFSLVCRMYDLTQSDPEYWADKSLWRIYDQSKA